MNRILVFRDTMDWIREEPALSAAVKASRAGTKVFMEGDTPSLPEDPKLAGEITVTPSRSFEAALRLRGEFPDAKIAVHNFASATNPGGGVEHGASAQEECLCRCSTLFPVLKKKELFSQYYAFHRARHDVRYTDACIWSPDIIICKTDTASPERMAKDDWCTVDILTCAAPNLRPKPYNQMNPGKGSAIRMTDLELLNLHKQRARHMLSVAAAQGDEVVVLGAFGCGAFRNDPKIVARAYKEILPEFAGCFTRIEFAVYCPPNHPENYQAFRKILG